MDRDIDDRDGNMDSNQHDIDDSGVGNEAGEEETEDLKRAVRKKTEDNHRQDINDPWVLGTRLGGTEAKKKTEDDHRQDINDPWVLGTRPGGTEAEKKTEDLNRLVDKNRLGFTHTDSKNKTEAKSSESKDRTEDGENKDHTRVFVKTHTGKIAKDLAKVPTKTHTGKPAMDHAEMDAKTLDEKLGKDHNRVFIRTLAGKLAKDLAKRLAKNHTGKAVTKGGDYPHDDSHQGTNVKTETDGNIHNRKAVPCDYAARHVAPSEGLDEEEQERQVVDNGEDIQHMSGGAKNKAMTNGSGKDLSRVFVGTLAGRLAKDLVKRLSKNHTGRRAGDLAKNSPGPTPGGSSGTAPGCSPGASPGGSPGTSPGCRPGTSQGGSPGILPRRSPGGSAGWADESASGGLCIGWGTDVHKQGTS